MNSKQFLDFNVASFDYTVREAEVLQEARTIAAARLDRNKGRPQFKTPSEALFLLAATIGADAEREHFYVVSLDCAMRVIHTAQLGIGTISSVGAPVREVLRSALLANAVSIILVHNHPSGDARPSKEDIELTVHTAEAAEMLGISLLDHYVIAAGEARSLRPELVQYQKERAAGRPRRARR